VHERNRAEIHSSISQKAYMKKTILWWGRSDNNYSRNQIIRKNLIKLNFDIIDFHPLVSLFGYYEALLKIHYQTDFIWVPCFRHRDISAAIKWARKFRIPIIFDPLISAWDKKINEKEYFSKESEQSKKLKNWESSIYQNVNHLIVDTSEHKKFFIKEFNLPSDKISIIYVGADEDKFFPQNKKEIKQKEVLFYGTGLGLHGTQTIVEASKLLKDKTIKWTLIGNFNKYENIDNLHIENSIPYNQLAKRINQADILLGIFGDTEKASNVIQNKVYQ